MPSTPSIQILLSSAENTVVALPDGDGWRQLTKPTDEDDAARILVSFPGKRIL
ncbi:MAG: hypothetical protein R2688_04345 [Fimbriimonadaceae bacterium]